MPNILSHFPVIDAVLLAAAAAQGRLRITREVNDVAVRAGESAMLECHITGPPDVDVDWLSDGKLIQPALLNCKMHFDGKRCWILFIITLVLFSSV